MKGKSLNNAAFKILAVAVAAVLLAASIPVAVGAIAPGRQNRSVRRLSVADCTSPNTLVYFEPYNDDNSLEYYSRITPEGGTPSEEPMKVLSVGDTDVFYYKAAKSAQNSTFDIVAEANAIYVVLGDTELGESIPETEDVLTGIPKIRYSKNGVSYSQPVDMKLYGESHGKKVYYSYTSKSSDYTKFNINEEGYTFIGDIAEGQTVCAFKNDGSCNIDTENYYGLMNSQSNAKLSILGDNTVNMPANGTYTKLIAFSSDRYAASDVTPAKISGINVMDNETSEEANTIYLNKNYLLKYTAQTGYTRLASVSNIEVENKSQGVDLNRETNVFFATTTGQKKFTLTYKNSVEEFSTDMEFSVSEEAEYPEITLKLDGKTGDNIVKYVPDGENVTLNVSAHMEDGAKIKYYGTEITNYSFIFSDGTNIKETSSSSYDQSLTGSQALRGEKQYTVKISFSYGGQTITSEVLAICKVDIKVPLIKTDYDGGYISKTTDAEITAADFEDVYYKSFDKGSTVNTDTEGYTKVTPGTFNALIEADEDTNKIISVLGFYDDKYINKQFEFSVDSQAPQIEKITAQSAGLAAFNILDFGIFANDKIQLTVDVSDNRSGIDNVILCKKSGNNYEPLDFTASFNGEKTSASFIIDAPEYGVFNETLAVQVTDKAGNQTTAALNNIESQSVVYTLLDSKVVIERIAPDITVQSAPVAEGSTANTYASDTNINISLHDEHSGIKGYSVNINGVTAKSEEDICKTSTELKHDVSFSVSTADVPKSSDGSYNVYVTAEDNAGNVSYDSKTTVYLDVTKPKIIGYKINVLGDSVTASNLLVNGSGAFVYNNDIELTITAKDSSNSVGFAEIFVTKNSYITLKEEPTQTTDTDGGILYTATYTVKKPFSGMIEASVSDRSGNYSETLVAPTSPDKECKLEICNKGNKYDVYWLDSAKYPNFAIHLSSDSNAMFTTFAPDEKPVYRGEGRNWYNSDVNITAVAEEYLNKGVYGINEYETGVSLNGSSVSKTYITDKQVINGVVASITYKFNSKQIVSKDTDGEYILSGYVTDGAENKSESSYTFYIDRKAPDISGFKMTPESSSNGTTANLVEKTEYGYFFKSNTTVTINAIDGSGNADADSGVKTIYYELVPTDGKTTTGELTGSSGKITVKSGFKGQIYAYAVDNVGNKGTKVNPSGVIVENEQLHKSTSSVKITLDKTGKKDISGNPLYSGDVNVKFNVTDTYSGIKSISYSVTAPYDTSKNVNDTTTVYNGTISDSSWKKEGSELNIVTAMSKSIKVSSNSNDIVVNLTLTDNAGNTSSKSVKFSIDKTSPTVSIQFDGNNGGYYSSSRTVTVTVRERNLNLSDINNYVSLNFASQNGGSVPVTTWSVARDRNNPDNTVFTGTAVFANDGSYTCSLSAVDYAGNKSSASKSVNFIIDKTAPVITFSKVERYNSTAQTITVTVNEANFNESAAYAALNITAQGGSAPSFSGWSNSGNTHTASAVFSADGDYTISMSYTDLAGNSSSANVPLFTVDVNSPVIKVKSLENKTSYTDNIISFSVDVTDANLDSVDIKLEGVLRDKVEFVSTVPYSATIPITNGTRYTWSNIKTGADGIYTLTCVAKDIAGNTTSVVRKKDGADDDNTKLVFSVNRDGSAYQISTESSSLMGNWVSDSRVITFSEVNADPIDLEKVVVKLTNKSTQEEIILKYGTDYTVERVDNGGKWYEYRYNILATNFSEDGYYDIEVMSVDATNKTTSSKDNAYGTQLIAYGLDTHEPVIDISGINNGPYDSITRDAVINVTDISLSEVTVYVDGKPVETWTAETAGDSYSGTITLHESAATQKVTVEATDAAGNKSTSEQEVFVSSNGFSIFMYRLSNFISNNWLWLIIGAAGAAAIIAFVIISKKKKKNDKTNKAAK